MSELRVTETNAADDSAGRAFGLDGNLYLIVVVAALGSLGLYAVLALILAAGQVLALLVSVPPLLATLGWAIGLRHGRPAGYDRDWLDQRIGGGSFTRVSQDQEGLS
jgi:hypothetical protein